MSAQPVYVHESAASWAAVIERVGALGPGEKAADVFVRIRGVVAARRAHSASTTFLELALKSDYAESGAVQICVNREALATAAQAEDTFEVGRTFLKSVRDLDQLDVGDVISCHGVPGRTRTGRNALSVFPSRLTLEQLRLEPDADRPDGATPSRVLRLLSKWREGHWSDSEAAALLQTTPALLHALRPALAASLDAHDAEREAQRAAKAPRTAAAPAREAPARLQRMREVAAARQGGLVLVMEEIERDNNIAAMLRSCDAFGVGEAILIRSDGAPPLDAETLRAASASADLWVHLERVGDTATALERLAARGFVSVGTALRDARGAPCAALAATPLLQPRLAIWVGNEARGLSAAALGALELLVTIPMAGMVESLNVSCCAAVMVAEAVRQRAAAGAKAYAATAAEAEEALRRMEAANARSEG